MQKISGNKNAALEQQPNVVLEFAWQEVTDIAFIMSFVFWTTDPIHQENAEL